MSTTKEKSIDSENRNEAVMLALVRELKEMSGKFVQIGVLLAGMCESMDRRVMKKEGGV